MTRVAASCSCRASSRRPARRCCVLCSAATRRAQPRPRPRQPSTSTRTLTCTLRLVKDKESHLLQASGLRERRVGLLEEPGLLYHAVEVDGDAVGGGGMGAPDMAGGASAPQLQQHARKSHNPTSLQWGRPS